MYGHEIRWYALLPVSIAIGLFAVLADMAGVWGDFPARPEWLWCLALLAALDAPPVPSIAAFAWCGLVRDFTLGPRLGSATLAYLAVGWMALYWKPLAAVRGWPGQALLAGAGAFVAALAKLGLDYGLLTHKLVDRLFFLAAADAVLTGIVYLPLAALLTLPQFRPWRERSGYF